MEIVLHRAYRSHDLGHVFLFIRSLIWFFDIILMERLIRFSCQRIDSTIFFNCRYQMIAPGIKFWELQIAWRKGLENVNKL